MNKIKITLIALLGLTILSVPAVQTQVTVKLKDVTQVAGIRDNQLIGYGLVVGLNGRGDSAKCKITKDTAVNLFQKFNVRIDPEDIISRNIAAVIVTAILPAFGEPGTRVDVKISSVGDAGSIENGELLQTPLKAADGSIYCVAQGTVVTVYKDKSDVFGRMTSGYIPNGALVERPTETSFVNDGKVTLCLSEPDFTTIQNAVTAVNDRFGSGTAVGRNSSLVDIVVPPVYTANLTGFLAEVGGLEIEPGSLARVVIDRRSGTVVMGGDVKVSTVAVSQKKFSIEINNPAGTSYFLDELNEKSKVQNTFMLEEAADVKTVVDGLNRMGAKTEDIISIMRALKAAGALHAELIVL
jgi:flagellar P-ring protein precursor FlgI